MVIWIAEGRGGGENILFIGTTSNKVGRGRYRSDSRSGQAEVRRQHGATAAIGDGGRVVAQQWNSDWMYISMK